MKIKKSIIRSILKETFKDVTPLVIEGRYKQQEYIEEFINKVNKSCKAQKLKANKTTSYYHDDRKQEYVYASLYWHDSYYDSSNLWVGFEENVLTLSDYSTEVGIDGSMEKLAAFYDKLELERDKLLFEINKKEKVKNIKANAIESAIIELAKEDKFEYYIETNSIRLNLYIKITSTSELLILIPFSKFQDAIKNVRETVQTIRQLTEQGLQFKIKALTRTAWKKVF